MKIELNKITYYHLKTMFIYLYSPYCFNLLLFIISLLEIKLNSSPCSKNQKCTSRYKISKL